MGINAKTIQDFVRGLITFSVDACRKCVEKHPVVFGVVLGFFLLFSLIPSLFYFLLYTSPVVFCIVVSIKIYSKTQNCKLQHVNVKRVEEKSFVESKSPETPPHVVSRNGDKTMIHSRRRNFKDKNRECDAEAGDKERKRRNHIEDLIAEDQKLVMGGRELYKQNAATAEIIQAPEDLSNETSLIEEKESSCLDRGESSMIDLTDKELVNQSENIGIGGGELEVQSSSASSDDAEDEAAAQQETNKAVEWTADDQQNLMDLGDSEIERNRRLESLIARRRARKLFRMALEKRALDPGCGSQAHIPPISILRSTVLNGPGDESFEGLHTPGSAPSVLPSRNPFDIPYDPSEEKPNLMSDSFQQEFSPAHQNDMFFPKYEGLCYGPSFSVEPQKDHNNSKFFLYTYEKKPEEKPRFSRFRTFSDISAHDQLIDNYLCQGQALFRMSNATNPADNGSQASKITKKAQEIKEGNREPSNGVRGIKEKTAPDEVSEFSFHGNPPTLPEILEPQTGNFPQKLSDCVQNSLTFSTPENIAYSGTAYDSCPSAVDKPKMENRFFLRDKMPCHSPVCSIASDLQVEVSEPGSPTLPIDSAMSEIESSYDEDMEKEMAYGSEDESRSRELSDALPPKIPQKHVHPIKDSVVHQPDGVHYEKPQELSNPPEKSATEVNAVCNADDQVVHLKNDQPSTSSSTGLSEEPSVEVVEGKSEAVISPVATVKSKDAEETDTGFVRHIEGKSRTVPECRAGISSLEPEEKIANSDFPGAKVKEEETSNCSEKPTTEANNISDPPVTKKEDKEELTAAETALQEVTDGGITCVIGWAPCHSAQQKSTDSVKAIAEGDTRYNMKETETEANDSMSNNNKENFLDQLQTSKIRTQFDILQNANETVGNEVSSMNSLIDQEQIAGQPNPVKPPTEVDVMHNMSETLQNEMNKKKSLTDQEHVSDQPNPAKATAEVSHRDDQQ